MRSLVPCRGTVTVATLVLCVGLHGDAAELPEVRQLVTFRFQPGMRARALTIYKTSLLPIYRDAAAMLRFRGYQEVESPEPLDLIVVSSFRGMAGIDTFNRQLARASHSGTPPVRETYGRLDDMSMSHHDQFVEMIDALGFGGRGSHGLHIFEYVRTGPGAARDYERLLASAVVSWERKRESIEGGETGRFLIADGWNYLRITRIGSLAEYHDVLMTARKQSFWQVLEKLIVERKVIVVREDPELAVR